MKRIGRIAMALGMLVVVLLAAACVIGHTPGGWRPAAAQPSGVPTLAPPQEEPQGGQAIYVTVQTDQPEVVVELR